MGPCVNPREAPTAASCPGSLCYSLHARPSQLRSHPRGSWPLAAPSPPATPPPPHHTQVAVEKFSHFLAPPRRGDLVVFTPPEAYLAQRNAAFPQQPPSTANPLVKRVVAIENDRIEVRDGRLLLNGSPMYEPYASELARYSLPPVTTPRFEHFWLHTTMRLELARG